MQSLPEIIVEGIVEQEKRVVELNREQLSKKLNQNNKTIAPKYSEDYAILKGFKDPDLKKTGEYYKSIFVVSRLDIPGVQIESDRVEDGFALNVHLEEKYGEDILGIPIHERRGVAVKGLENNKNKILNELKNS